MNKNHCGIVTVLRNVRQHPNADKVKLATCYGNQIVVGLDNQDGDLGVYFPCDLALSNEFAHANNLYRDKTKNSDPNDKPGMFDDNRRVRAQKFRGEISDGFWVPMSYFSFIKKLPTELLEEGYEFDAIKGTPICNKYINPSTIKAAQQNQPKKTKTAKTSIMFKEHIDTSHFGRCAHEVKPNDLIIITEKFHGTSHRVGNVLVARKLKWYESILRWLNFKIDENEWVYLNGTRRVVLEESKRNGPQYHNPTIRDNAFSLFEGNLRKGETVYLEIVGYDNGSTPIMPAVDTSALKDKEFTQKYSNMGNKTHMVYSYGCVEGTSDVYVYRMTMTNVDGQSVDYSWDDVMRRCNELGVKYVPELARFTVNELKAIEETKGRYFNDDREFQDFLLNEVDIYSKGASLVDKTHIREGVCVRLESGLVPRIYKHKSFEFKVLEGLAKDSGVVDMEESN
jgi:hypothetical protein